MSAVDTTDTDRRTDAPMLPDAVREESPATKLVYLTLRAAAEPLTYRELAETTALGDCTVKRAVLALRDADAVESLPAATSDSEPPTKQHRAL
jgi:predicted AAA+ superfamily ATPase